MNHPSQTQEDKKNHISSFFICQLILIFRFFLLGNSLGLHAMFGTWGSISSPPRILLSRHIILLCRFTASSGCCRGDAQSPPCLHELQIFLSFLSTPTSVQKHLLLAVRGVVCLSPAPMFFSKRLCFSLLATLLPFFHLSKMRVISKRLEFGRQRAKTSLVSVL